jgi:uncharacterized protein (DUF2236 family)
MKGTVGDEAGRDGARPPLAAAGRSDPDHGTGHRANHGANHGADHRARHRPADPAPDDESRAHWGLFGPESITWRVHSDPLFGPAVLRSLMLRVLHPEGLAGVFTTAARVDDPWERLAWTQGHLGVATFGDSSEALTSGARLRAVLMQLQGTTADGGHYRADDPEMLTWMHCCQVASALEVTRRGGLDLTDREAELYVREQVRMAALSGLEPDEVPAGRAGLTRYFRRVRPQLRMTAAARAFIGAVVNPSVPDVMRAWRDRPIWAPVAGLAFACLPARERALYGTPLGSGPATLSQAATTVALHSLRDSLRGHHDQTGADTMP